MPSEQYIAIPDLIAEFIRETVNSVDVEDEMKRKRGLMTMIPVTRMMTMRMKMMTAMMVMTVITLTSTNSFLQRSYDVRNKKIN